ncbi:MAG: hypothetical protein WBP26_03775 [Candidatus Saccharimonadales bacterium]
MTYLPPKFGVSNLGNTLGVTGTVNRGIVFAGGNNITLSQSVNASSATVSISAASQSVQTQNRFNMSLSGNTSGVMAQISSGTLTLAGGNNITLSQSVNAVTISGAPAFSAGLSSDGYGQTGMVTNRVVFMANTNMALIQVTDSLGASVILSANAFSGGVSNLGNSSGMSGTVSNQMVFAGGNNITLSQSTNSLGATVTISGGPAGGIALANSQTTYTSGIANLIASGALTIASTTGQSFNLSVPQTSSLSASGALSIVTNGNTISFGAGNTYSQFDPNPNGLMAMASNGQSLHVQPVQAPSFQHDRALIPIQLSNNNASIGSATVTAWLGLYTRNASTLSLAYSSSGSVGITYSGTTNNSTYAGIRNMSVGWSNTVPANDYWLGMVSRTSIGGNNASVSQMVASQINSSFSGDFGVASNATNQFKLGLGYYSATTAGMPSSIGFQEINGSAPGALRPPIVKFVSQTA